MNDQKFKAELMKRSKDVLADRIIELTRICDKETERADKMEVEAFQRINLLVNNATSAAQWLLETHPGSAPYELGQQLQLALNFNDKHPIHQSKKHSRPTPTD
jgi:hypothetical protein